MTAKPSKSLLATLFLFLACSGRETLQPAAEPQPVPVFIVSIDTLRSDRLSVYGDQTAKTPSFDRLRKDAILFEHAFTHTPLTLPAHASLLTGRLPTAHRVRDNAGYALPNDMQTLPGALRAHGYATGAAVSSRVLRRSTGIARDFDFFDDSLPTEREERAGHDTRGKLGQWISSRGDRNIFGFLHGFEPHTPHASTYEADVTAADEVLGAFLDDLDRAKLYRDALVIVLSDHGEGLGDHGEDEHGVFLYREVIQIPLLVKLPGNARGGERVATPVAIVDIFPTVLESAGVTAKSDLDGRSLLKAEPGRAIYAETFFPRLHLGWSESFSLIDASHHYIDAPRSELYRYPADRAERNNVIADDRRVAAAMRARLEAIDRSLNPPGPVSDEDRRVLAALGYLGSGAHSSGPLPDAKDRIHTLRTLKSAYAAMHGGDARRAASILERLTQEAPELVDAWSLLAESQLRLLNSRRAAATLRTAVARFPSRTDLRTGLARILLESGDLAGAQREVDAALAVHPTETTLLMMAAELALRRRDPAAALGILDRVAEPIQGLDYRRSAALLELGRVADAEMALRREVERFPQHTEAWGALAAVLAGQNRIVEARGVLRSGLQRNPTYEMRQVARDTLIAAGDQDGIRQLGLQ